MLELTKLGIRNLPQSNAFLFCSACTLCTRGCPQGVHVHEVFQVLKEQAHDDPAVIAYVHNQFPQALSTLAKGIPLPVAYTWVCLNPAEEEGDTDAARIAYKASIRKVMEDYLVQPLPQPLSTAKDAARVAVIGSGPAGLTAAWYLAHAGLQVTVYESLPAMGGMLRTGIPEFRLPKEFLDREIARLEALGIRLLTNTPITKETFANLLADGSCNDDQYQAVFIASGAYSSRKLRLEGEEYTGVLTAVEFLKEFNLNGSVAVGQNVVVIGGGNVATDAAGVAARSGAKSVRLFCLEDRDLMPAHEWEITDIIHAGVEVNPGWGPKAILGVDGRVENVEFMRCLSVTDSSGRFAPRYDESKTIVADVDTLITAIGQGPDLSFLADNIERFRGAVQVDPYTMETNMLGIFAAGDAVAGTASMVEAILGGKKAADSIIGYLGAKEAYDR